MGDLGCRLIHGSLGPPKSTLQMVSQSVQPFLQGSRLWQTDRQTDIYISLWTFWMPLICIYLVCAVVTMCHFLHQVMQQYLYILMFNNEQYCFSIIVIYTPCFRAVPGTWVMRCWCDYLFGARCIWFAYGRADTTATTSPLASLKSTLV